MVESRGTRYLPIVAGCDVVTPKLLRVELVDTTVVGCVVVTLYEDTAAGEAGDDVVVTPYEDTAAGAAGDDVVLDMPAIDAARATFRIAATFPDEAVVVPPGGLP